MKTFQTKLLFAFLAGLFLLSSCGRGGNANQNSGGANRASGPNANANVTKDDAEEFSKTVNLPVPPEEVAWRESGTPGRKKLLAVLKFSAEAAQALVAQAERRRPAVAAEIDAEDWFPPELVAQSEQSGDATLKGSAYAADDFLLEPYKNGQLTRVHDTNFFVLELTDQ